jgi:signal transduction histidine kinase
MPSSTKSKSEFALALLLLCLSGTATGLVIFRLYQAEGLVRHTYNVQVAIGDLESSLADVGRSRADYVSIPNDDSLKSYEDSFHKVAGELARIRQLTRDNPSQQILCDQLESNANERLAPSQRSVELVQRNLSTPEKQLLLSFEAAKSGEQTAGITLQMRQNEDRLLVRRSQISEFLFTVITVIIALSFLLSGVMFWLHFRLLSRELHERANAEGRLRQLSLQLMRVQDEEHRRFGRELHDGLGQSLASAKMMLDSLPGEYSEQLPVKEVSDLLGDALSQTRTISYLFHPPFLDEVGFASAAKWLIQGYARRDGIEVSADIAESQERLPHGLELTLYRVLQEALNNVHRHSKSSRADVSLRAHNKIVTLRVRDFGLGITSDRLAAIEATGDGAGVGLTGMRERVREQGGKLDIRSDGVGTEIIVTIPIESHLQDPSPSQTAL